MILSALLGSHPPFLPVQALVRMAELFGISEGTTRVALSRLAADGDVVAEAAAYRLSDRLLTRQRSQDEGLRPATKPWRGGWEMAVAAPDVRDAAARAALGAELANLHLAELRPGVWTRPDNLQRDWPESLEAHAWRFDSRPAFAEPDGAQLARELWPLDEWAERAEALIRSMTVEAEPAQRFMIAAAMVRHLRTDPMLPPALLPGAWPGTRLRNAYRAYQVEMGDLMRRERARHTGT